MYNQSDYQKKQQLIFKQASSLAANGQDCGELVGLLDPDHTLRLRAFVRDLPEEVRTKSIFGRANAPIYAKKRK